MIKPFLRFSLGLFLSSICVFAFAEAGSDPSAVTTPVLLEIDGAKITYADVERKQSATLFQARNTFYQAERKAVEEFIAQYLLERQAQKEQVTVAKLLELHVNSKIPGDPPEEAVKVYFEGVDTTEPYSVVRGQILDHIRENRLMKAKAAYMASLRTDAKIGLHFGPPRAPIAVADKMVRGVPDAPVVVVEYADYECPYCQQAQPALDKMLADYQGKVNFAYKDVPLPGHAHAQKAAEATHCAGEQGKFWEFHDLLFKTKQLDIPQLKDHARELNLDTAAFGKCLDSGAQAELVKKQSVEGQSLGLQGTPSFFINGRFFSNGLSYDQLRAVIQEELTASEARVKESAKR